MKIVSMVCPNCGASIQVDADKKNLICNYCGNSLFVDDEVHHVQYDNAEEAGYQFEKGRQRAQAEAKQSGVQPYSQTIQQPPVKKRKTWLWVLGWIFIFPLPLTILLLRKKEMKPALKYGIIAAAWIVYLLIGLTSGAGDSSNNQSTSDQISVSSAPNNQSEDSNIISESESTEYEKVVSEDTLADFYEEFLKSGTVDNIKEMAKEYGLYSDSRKTGTGRELFKVAETQEEARVTSNDDAYKGDYYVRIECTILGDDTVDSVELVDNRNGETSEASETTTDNKEITSDSMYALISDFIKDYNSIADNKITNSTNYDIHEEHYRTEYRLQAFDDSVGTFGEATDSTFEIVASRPGMFSDGILTYRNLRIYGNFNDADSAKKALETIIPIIDSSITVEMIQNEYSEYRPDEVNTFIKGESGDVTFYIIHAPSSSEYKYELFID